jgi:threonine synthase
LVDRGGARAVHRAGETIVCTVTGHGLKDPNRAIAEVDTGRPSRPT